MKLFRNVFLENSKQNAQIVRIILAYINNYF